MLRLPNMSLGNGGKTALRATAHPVRLQIMSLLTGASLTAAEVARELGLTHANASYHLRTLLAAGLIVPAGEERIRGGIAKRYRYDAASDIAREKARGRRPDEGRGGRRRDHPPDPGRPLPGRGQPRRQRRTLARPFGVERVQGTGRPSGPRPT